MLESTLTKLRAFLNGKWASVLYTAIACLSVSFSLEQYAIPLFILWVLFVLVLDSSFLNVFLPVTLLCGFAIRTSGQSTYLMNHVWMAIPLGIVLVIHFVLHGRRRALGKLFWAQVAISVALILGGVFSISAADYFRLDSLYYVLILGVGMIFFYVWFRNGVYSNEYYDCREKLMECFLFLGVFCTYSILDQALRFLIVLGEPMASFVWSNDICELMLFCIPAAFYYARNQYSFAFLGLGFYGVMMFTRSYAALISGGVLLVLCFVYLLKYRKTKRALTLTFFSLFCLAAVLVFFYLARSAGGIVPLFNEEENGRLGLIREAWEKFLSSPIFGVGIGAPGEKDITFMTVYWTHNFLFQILGSMGILGILAYGYQFFARCRLVFSSRDPFRMAAALSYLGLFLVSMLQPGEFCPMPYAMMAVMVFTVIENSDEEQASKAKNEEKSAISS